MQFVLIAYVLAYVLCTCTKSTLSTRIIIRESLAYEDLGSVSINTNQITYLKQIKTEQLKYAVDTLHDILKAHNMLCRSHKKEMETPPPENPLYIIHENFLLPNEPGYTYDMARQVCASAYNRILPEVRTNYHKYMLETIMRQNALDATFAGIYTEPVLKDPRFKSDSTTAEKVVFDRVCTKSNDWNYLHNSPISHPTWLYKFYGNSIRPCSIERLNLNDHHMKAAICQRQANTDDEHLKHSELNTALTQRCDENTRALKASISDVNSNLQLILPNYQKENATNNKRHANIDKNGLDDHERPERAILTALSAAGITFRLINEFIKWNKIKQISKVATENSISIGKLEITTIELQSDINQNSALIAHVKKDIMQLKSTIARSFMEQNLMQKFQQLHMTFVQAVMLWLVSLQDAKRGTTSPILLSHTELNSLNLHNLQNYYVKLDTDLNHIDIEMVQDNKGNFHVQYNIPTIQEERMARLYSVIALPTFRDNKRYTPVLDAKYIVVSITNSKYAHVLEHEVDICIRESHKCFVSSPLRLSHEGTCVAAAFFEDKCKCKYTISNNLSPYFYTRENYTIFSVATHTEVKTHCDDLQSPGPDLKTTLLAQTKGILSTKTTCTLAANDYTILPNNIRIERIEILQNSILTSKTVHRMANGEEYTGELNTVVFDPKQTLTVQSLLNNDTLRTILIIAFVCILFSVLVSFFLLRVYYQQCASNVLRVMHCLNCIKTANSEISTIESMQFTTSTINNATTTTKSVTHTNNDEPIDTQPQRDVTDPPFNSTSPQN